MSRDHLQEAERLAAQFRREIDARFQSTDSWISEIEAKQNTARSHSPGGDAWIDALPEQYRHQAEVAERMGHRDPVKSACFGAWWDLHVKLASQGLRPTPGGAAAIEADLERIERGWNGIGRGRVTKSLSEGTNSQGGFTVATPVEAELYRLIRDNGVVRPLATKIVMGGPTVQLPGEGSNVTAFIVPESTTITESTAATASQFTQTPLIARKIAGLATVTHELMQDNIISLQDYLFTAIAEHIGILEDQGALDGSSGNFTGLDLATGVNSFTTAGTSSGGDSPTYGEYITAIFTAKQRGSRQNGRFFMHPTAFKNALSLVDTSGQPIVTFSNVPNAIPYSIAGFPVELVSSLSLAKTIKTSSTNVYFGPANRIIFGDVAGMQFDVDPYSLFTKALVNVRVLKRTGIAVPTPSAWTIVHGAKNS